jgi:predicted metal-dependent peptidase
LQAADARSPDGIVYLTDGWVAQVTTRPRAPVLWLLTPGGRDPEAPETARLLRGRRVRMRFSEDGP